MCGFEKSAMSLFFTFTWDNGSINKRGDDCHLSCSKILISINGYPMYPFIVYWAGDHTFIYDMTLSQHDSILKNPFFFKTVFIFFPIVSDGGTVDILHTLKYWGHTKDNITLYCNMT